MPAMPVVSTQLGIDKPSLEFRNTMEISQWMWLYRITLCSRLTLQRHPSPLSNRCRQWSAVPSRRPSLISSFIICSSNQGDFPKFLYDSCTTSRFGMAAYLAKWHQITTTSLWLYQTVNFSSNENHFPTIFGIRTRVDRVFRSARAKHFSHHIDF